MGTHAICLRLLHFQLSMLGQSVGMFSDNTIALSYIQKQGGTFSAALNHEDQLLLCWVESLSVTLVPQFIKGAWNVVADSLSRQDQLTGSEWTLAQEVVDELRVRWPVMVDLFATSLNYCLPVYFSPLSDLMAPGMDAFLQSWDGLQAYAFPPFTLIRRVLSKLRSWKGTLLTLVAPLWPQKELFPEPFCGSSNRPSVTCRSSKTAACPSPSPEPPCAAASFVETL